MSQVKKDVFTVCSYCCVPLKSNANRKRCQSCKYVVCKNCIDATSNTCQNCLDKEKGKDKKTITSIKSAIIIGAGIGGLASALALKKKGVESVKVFERENELRTLGGGINVQANALHALRSFDIDVQEKLANDTGKLNSLGGFTHASGKMIYPTVLSGPVVSRFNPLVGGSIKRASVQKCLHAGCKKHGVEIFFGTKFKSYTLSEDSVTVKFENGNEETADFLVAADGIWSRIRKQYDEKIKVQYSGYQAFVGSRPQEKFDQDSLPYCFQELWGKGTRFGYFRAGIDGTTFYAFRNAPKDYGIKDGHEKWKNDILDMMKKGKYEKQFIEFVENVDAKDISLTNINYIPNMKKQFVSKRMVFVGDAAHAFPPTLGQGACMAMEDAAVLGQSLMVSDDLNGAMKMYEKRRVIRNERVSKNSIQNGKLFQASNAFKIFLRTQLFKFLAKKANNPNIEHINAKDAFDFLQIYQIQEY